MEILKRKRERVYDCLIEDMLFQIKNGLLKAGDYLPSENVLSRKYKISRISVRAALEELAKRDLVEKKAGKGTIVKENSLYPSKKKNRTIGITFLKEKPEVAIENPFYGPILESTEEKAQRYQYHVLLNSVKDMEDELDFYKKIKVEKVDGLLIIGIVKDEILDCLLKITPHLPFCLIDYSPPGRELNCVVSANAEGMYEATKHLIELGHKKIAFIGWSPWEPNIPLRLEGYKKALSESGLNIDSSLVEEAKLLNGEDGYQPMRRLLRSRLNFTAVVCANDGTIAFPAMKAIREAGLKIPEDVSVVGYDDIHFSTLIHPPLTTVAVDKKNMGREAVKRLVALIENPFLPPKTITVKTELIIRGSTAPPKKKERR